MAGCVGSLAINIKVDKPITASVTTNLSNVSTLCTNTPAVFDATASTNVSMYTWPFMVYAQDDLTSKKPSAAWASLTKHKSVSGNNHHLHPYNKRYRWK
ncbi:MAG: hypothetical protein HYU69_06710 [Bacteroidetes bacterium]|nr:hypothetical protein [Bacteroidota bacterium]